MARAAQNTDAACDALSLLRTVTSDAACLLFVFCFHFGRRLCTPEQVLASYHCASRQCLNSEDREPGLSCRSSEAHSQPCQRWLNSEDREPGLSCRSSEAHSQPCQRWACPLALPTSTMTQGRLRACKQLLQHSPAVRHPLPYLPPPASRNYLAQPQLAAPRDVRSPVSGTGAGTAALGLKTRAALRASHTPPVRISCSALFCGCKGPCPRTTCTTT